MKIAERDSKKKISLRSMSTLSLLPENSIYNDFGSLFVSKDLSFLITRITEMEEYYELAWSYPEEIALISSLTIGAQPDYGKVCLFPVRWPTYIEDEGQDLSDPTIIKEISDFYSNVILENKTSNSWEEQPPILINRPYQTQSINLNKDYQSYLFASIDINDELLIRGLSHLMKTTMLKQLSRTFLDTACMEIYIALEASLEIIFRRLKNEGNKNPTNKDASDFLLESFSENHRLDRYYEDYYDDRIKVVHPNSRFGLAMFSPIYVDDLYMLYDDLLRNFEFLITNKPRCFESYYCETSNKHKHKQQD